MKVKERVKNLERKIAKLFAKAAKDTDSNLSDIWSGLSDADKEYIIPAIDIYTECMKIAESQAEVIDNLEEELAKTNEKLDLALSRLGYLCGKKNK